jgi:uncharacterized integral membrane protein
VPRARAGVAWLGICTTAVIVVVLVVFVVQNTRSVEITFLWMHGRVPLAVLLLVATVGTARIAQRRRPSRTHRNTAP